MTLPGQHPVDLVTPGVRQQAQVSSVQRGLDGVSRALAPVFLHAWNPSNSGSIADSTWTTVPLTTTSIDDPLGMLASNTITIKKSGLYLISGFVEMTNPNNAGGPFRAQFVRTSAGGGTYVYNHVYAASSASWARDVPLPSQLQPLFQGETFQLQGQHVGGGTTTVFTNACHTSLLWIAPR